MRIPFTACALSLLLVACKDDLEPPTQAPGETPDVAVVYERGPHLAQCAAPAITLGQSTAKLTQAGITALRSSCGSATGVFYPTVCGAGTAEILVHNIPADRLPAATAAGFASVDALVDAARGTSWQRFRCDGYQAYRDIAMQTAGCAQTRNRLLRIDHRTQGDTDLVLLDQAGTCADAAYRQVLYGATPANVLCSNAQTIAGPVKNCAATQYTSLFDTILANSGAADLGLGPEYVVVAITQ